VSFVSTTLTGSHHTIEVLTVAIGVKDRRRGSFELLFLSVCIAFHVWTTEKKSFVS
jgi:hypothetical protein